MGKLESRHQAIEEELKVKKQKNAKISRELAGIEKNIREKVGSGFQLNCKMKKAESVFTAESSLLVSKNVYSVLGCMYMKLFKILDLNQFLAQRTHEFLSLSVSIYTNPLFSCFLFILLFLNLS